MRGEAVAKNAVSGAGVETMVWQQLSDPENPENRNAGNGGDLGKHTVCLAVLDHLLARPPWSEQLRVRECHAGRGMYRIPTNGRRLLDCLYHPLRSDVGVVLHDAQRASQTALSVWPAELGRAEWYGGSAVLNAWRLGHADTGGHLLELYEQAADTRAVLRALFADPGLQLPRLGVRILPEPEHGGDFDGEEHIEANVSVWDGQDLILLDPFAMWRQNKDRARRDRYRRIVERVIALGKASPLLILFWTWGQAFPAADGDLAGTNAPVPGGYQDLRDLLHRANRRFVRVTWRWGLQFAMWVVVPDAELDALTAELQRRCTDLSRHVQRHGARLVNPDITALVD
jgi:hypothetical protein